MILILRKKWHCIVNDGLVSILDINLNFPTGGQSSKSAPKLLERIAIDEVLDENVSGFEVFSMENRQTLIHYELIEDSFVEVILYDLSGNIINSLEKKRVESGIYESILGTSTLASGIYIYKIIMNGSSKSIKVFHP